MVCERRLRVGEYPFWGVECEKDPFTNVQPQNHTAKTHYLIALNFDTHSMWIRGHRSRILCNVRSPTPTKNHRTPLISTYTPVYTKTVIPSPLSLFSLYQPYAFPCIAPHRRRLPDLIAAYCSFRVLLNTHHP